MFPWDWSCPAAEGGLVHPALCHRPVLIPYPTALLRDGKHVLHVLLPFPWAQPVLQGEGEAPLVLPAVGSAGACGAACGAALGTARLEISALEKNVAVFSEAAPPPCSVKCESGPARGSRPYKGGRGGNSCSASAMQKPPRLLSNRP